MKSQIIPLNERFWNKVKKTEDCWIWTAYLDNKGYGRFLLNGKNKLAHRVSMELSGIYLIPGLFADHKCRNRSCVNPSHLRQVTPKTNTIENSLSLQARNAARTHCINGHEFSGQNLYKSKYGRACRACHKLRAKRKNGV